MQLPQNEINLILTAINDFIFNNYCGDEDDEFIANYRTSILPVDDWDSGASKFVLLPRGKNYVVKIPYSGGWYHPDDEWDEEIGEWVEQEACFEEFEGSYVSGEGTWDYCAREEYLYKIAQEYGVEKYFLQTQRIGYVNDHPIYIQERADEIGYGKGEKTYSDEERDSTREELKKRGLYGRLNICWSMEFLASYGYDEYEKLIKFLEDEYVTDLHSGNIGYKDGKPVLIDYCGFES